LNKIIRRTQRSS